MSDEKQKQKRLNITLTGDDVDLIEDYKNKINKELTANFSMAQIVKRLIRLAAAHNL